MENRIYGGKQTSKAAGGIAVGFLVVAVMGVLWANWTVVVVGLAGFAGGSFLGFRLSGGQGNPGLVEVEWEKKAQVDAVGDPIGTWPAKVTALFDLLERDTAGDYAVALRRLHILHAPVEVHKAYQEAVRRPSIETWTYLKEEMLRNPPTGERLGG